MDVTWLRFAGLLTRTPFALPFGKFRLRNVHGGSGRRNIAAASVAAALAEWLKSYAPRVAASDTASAGTPSSAPSRAPATVPEYVTSSPRFQPLLMPETTMSGRRLNTCVTAMLPQSVGVPSTA